MYVHVLNYKISLQSFRSSCNADVYVLVVVVMGTVELPDLWACLVYQVHHYGVYFTVCNTFCFWSYHSDDAI